MKSLTTKILSSAALLSAIGAAPASANGGGFVTSEPPMLRGDSPATSSGWEVTPLFTVSESIGKYQPVGILDGIGAYRRGFSRAQVLVSHELGEGNGYAYTLQNGTVLNGARISSFELRRRVFGFGSAATGSFDILGARLAYDTVYDRNHAVVTDAAQINETGIGTNGFARFCSSMSVAKGTFGFEDDLYFAGEETGKPFHPHGGTEWVLDVHKRDLWAAPALGRGAWENVTPLETGDAGTVALLLGDDSAGAPLYLYVGQKDAVGDKSFLDRNGLLVGRLYAWAADSGDLDPQTFNGLNSARTGTFVEVTVRDVAMAGQPGYDAAGYADIDTLQAQADALGCFSFSRPEDLATNPLDGSQAVFASTGRGQLYPADNWGTVYVADVDFSDLSAELVIIHDADGLPVPDAGIRNPDNLEWALDGKVYLQEDRSTSPSSLFGAATGIEASLWQLDPITRATTRVAEIDRSAVVPAGTTDSGVGQIGHWESSGVIDVTALFRSHPGERLLLATVQAHGIEDGPIGGNALLDEGGQLVLLSSKP